MENLPSLSPEMESLLASPQAFLERTPRVVRANGERALSQRKYFVVALHLAGRKAEEIAELSGYTRHTVYAILRSDEAIRLRQQILSGLSDEFEALYSEVIDVIRECLLDPDPKVRLEAVEKWMKAHGRYKSEGKGITVSAEDVVIQILNQGV